ncbi:unnamed protein product [Ectocarpus sp. 4 AP-2014]
MIGRSHMAVAEEHRRCTYIRCSIGLTVKNIEVRRCSSHRSRNVARVVLSPMGTYMLCIDGGVSMQIWTLPRPLRTEGDLETVGRLSCSNFAYRVSMQNQSGVLFSCHPFLCLECQLFAVSPLVSSRRVDRGLRRKAV